MFTKALSEALECLAEFGESHGLTRDDLAHVGIVDLLACRDAMSDPGGFLARRVVEGRERTTSRRACACPARSLPTTTSCASNSRRPSRTS